MDLGFSMSWMMSLLLTNITTDWENDAIMKCRPSIQIHAFLYMWIFTSFCPFLPSAPAKFSPSSKINCKHTTYTNRQEELVVTSGFKVLLGGKIWTLKEELKRKAGLHLIHDGKRAAYKEKHHLRKTEMNNAV